jgi:hypothetical protein
MRSRASGWAGTYRTLLPLPKTRRWGTPWRLWRSEHAQAAQFLAAQSVVQERRQDGPVPFPFEGVGRGRFQERAGLAVAQGGRLALVPFRFGALDPAHRVVAHGVRLAEVVEERSDGGEFPADGTGANLSPGASKQFPSGFWPRIAAEGN